MDKYIKCYSKQDCEKLKRIGFEFQRENNGIFIFFFDENLYQQNKMLFSNPKKYKITSIVDF